MEHTQDNSGIPAASCIRMPNSDDTTNAAANLGTSKHIRTLLPRPFAHGHLAPHGLTPPQDVRQVQQGEYNTSQYDQYHGDTVPSNFKQGHPPTPPRQEDELQWLQRWNAQNQYEDHIYTPVAHDSYVNTFRVPQEQQPADQYSSNIHSTSTGFPDATLNNQRLWSYARSAQRQQPHAYAARNAPPVYFQSHLDKDTRSLTNQQPPIQQWPTHALGSATSRKVPMSPRKPSTPWKRKFTPQPSDSGQPSLPPSLRIQPPPPQDYHGQSSPYSHLHTSLVPSTPPYPHMMNLFVPSSPCQQIDGLPRLLPTPPRGHFNAMNHPFTPAPVRQYDRRRHPTQRKNNVPEAYMAPPVEPKPEPSRPIDWDTIPQEITGDYENYKWSVIHYEVDSGDTYGFAQSWLEDLFAANLPALEYKWHSHSTQGFIEEGTRNSFIALHNADNPFQYGFPLSSTTSIGVYGHNWHEHNTIHWKTFAPDIRWLLQYCELQAGNIRVKQKWTCNMPMPSERRFHRAYWLAATRGPIGRLLNRGPSNDLPHDAVEDDGDFELIVEDVGNEWENTVEEAEEAWKRVREEIEDMGDVSDAGYEHVITGSSECE
jgi:hypothetical protein